MNVIIDGNYIFSPSHECIEIKCENANEDNTNYKVINNTLHGSKCLYIGQNGVANIKNFIVDSNYFKNYTNAGGSVIINNFVETFISNCIFEYDSSVSTTAISSTYSVSTPTEKNKLHIQNCHFEEGTSVFSISSDYVSLFLDNCSCKGCTRVSRVNANSEWFVNNCDIKTTNESFDQVKGKIFINNSQFDNTITLLIVDSDAIASLTNCKFKSSSEVINRTTGNTPKVGVVLCDYSESNRLSNAGLAPSLDFTTMS
jgi:hypothetical protein